MTTEQARAMEIAVRKIETVTGDFYTEQGEPFWRIELGGYCADFDHEAAANNFASIIAAALAEKDARIRELEGALKDCADDLEAFVRGRWCYTSGNPHPGNLPRFEEDMRPVCKARAILLTKHEGTEP